MSDSLPPTVWGIGVDPGLDGAIVAMRQDHGQAPVVVGAVRMRDVYCGNPSGTLTVFQVLYALVRMRGVYRGNSADYLTGVDVLHGVARIREELSPSDRVRVVIERPILGRRDGQQGSRAQLAAVLNDVGTIESAMTGVCRWSTVKMTTADIQRAAGIQARGATRKRDIFVALRNRVLRGEIAWPTLDADCIGPRGALRDGVTDAAMMALAALVQARALWWPRQTVGGAA